ncbi:putative ABC-2 type transport system permease protein [Richelia intracellularis HM01]|uniref:ABC transporter permease n=1 Tax=Richelia intracellularis TaxID=1164990 RepID=UPI0002B4FA25|nr:ABC transporter permease [Richelia intracellularis]CCH64833.1 putative ABC-2 type transport system permease protein [Richelia intracellularis HM01]
MAIIFGNIVAIYRRELQSYFVSPLAYIIAGIFWLLSGLFLISILIGPDGILSVVELLDAQKSRISTPIPPIDVAYEFLQTFLDRMGWLLLFISPILSMGLYSQERKQGTLELLATSPITNWSVALGKLLGVVTFFITMILPIFALENIILSYANPSISLLIPIVGHIGLILLAAAILSLGMFISSLTESTVFSAILTFAATLLLLFFDIIARGIGGSFGYVLGYLSPIKHYNSFIQGIFDTSSLIFFSSSIVLGIFLTSQSIDVLNSQRE